MSDQSFVCGLAIDTQGSAPQVVTTAAGKPGETFSDVHVVMVHEVGGICSRSA
jgi:hypothetical protein